MVQLKEQQHKHHRFTLSLAENSRRLGLTAFPVDDVRCFLLPGSSIFTILPPPSQPV